MDVFDLMINSQLSIRFQSSLELFPLNEEAETSDGAKVVSDCLLLVLINIKKAQF